MKRLPYASEKGFTLMEVLVVTAIIGVVAAIVLPDLNIIRLQSEDKRNIAYFDGVQLGLQQFQDVCGGLYPTSLDAGTNPNCPGILLSEFIENQIDLAPATTPFTYASFALAPSSSLCVGYHLAIEMSEESTYLGQDSDSDTSSVASAGWYGCSGSASGFDGGAVGDVLYDVTLPRRLGM